MSTLLKYSVLDAVPIASRSFSQLLRMNDPDSKWIVKMYESMFLHMIEEYMIVYVLLHECLEGEGQRMRAWGSEYQLSFNFYMYTTISWSNCPNLTNFYAFFKCHYRSVVFVICIQRGIFRALSLLLIIH